MQISKVLPWKYNSSFPLCCFRYMSLLSVVMVTQTMVSLFLLLSSYNTFRTELLRAHGRTDTAKLIGAFCDHANAPKTGTL